MSQPFDPSLHPVGRLCLVYPFVVTCLAAGCPSGQWERTVNPSAYAYTGSNPVPATKILYLPPRCMQVRNRPLRAGVIGPQPALPQLLRLLFLTPPPWLLPRLLLPPPTLPP